MPESKRLSEKSATILGLIAEGHSYSQIVDGHPETTYLDIFAAAEEALRLSESPSDYEERMRKIKSRYPRAYERWDRTEDETLGTLHRGGRTVPQIAEKLQRQPSAIRSRLAKLNLVTAE
jgi:hypothetical protein